LYLLSLRHLPKVRLRNRDPQQQESRTLITGSRSYHIPTCCRFYLTAQIGINRETRGRVRLSRQWISSGSAPSPVLRNVSSRIPNPTDTFCFRRTREDFVRTVARVSPYLLGLHTSSYAPARSIRLIAVARLPAPGIGTLS
jgi:hypothetical protein